MKMRRKRTLEYENSVAGGKTGCFSDCIFLISNCCGGMQILFEKHKYKSVSDLFRPIITTREQKSAAAKASDSTSQENLPPFQKNPAKHRQIDRARYIIIDNPWKYHDAEWQANVVKCMWPPPGKENQQESADAFVYGMGVKQQVPMLRILVRLLLDALYKSKLYKSDVRGALMEVQKHLDLAFSMVGFLIRSHVYF